MKTYYITKYALTTGILEVQGDVFDEMPTMMRYRREGCTNYAHRNEWHDTLYDAMTRAEEMRHEKLVSLKKQIEKLTKLRIAVKKIQSERTS